jgi:glucose-1-phosphate cytidylyltransferase
MIKRYFYDYEILNCDFTIELGSRKLQIYDRHAENGWQVTLVDTGLEAMTGARVKRAQKYIHGDLFLLTYGDGVTDLNINQLVAFHRSHGKIGTVTGVCPPSRYGELQIQGGQVVSFREKPRPQTAFISGGYFVFKREFLGYLSDRDDCVMERDPLERLAADGQLMVYNHTGFWQCMDTYRDYSYLQELVGTGKPPWMVWR